jgi:hypothetical protein
MMGLMELAQIERLALHRRKLGLLLRIEHADRLGQLFLPEVMQLVKSFAILTAGLAVLTAFMSQFAELLGEFVPHGGELLLLLARQTQLADDVGILKGVRAGHLDRDFMEPRLLWSVEDFRQLRLKLRVDVLGNLGELRAHLAGAILSGPALAVFAGRIVIPTCGPTGRLHLLLPFRANFGQQVMHLVRLIRSKGEFLLHGFVSKQSQRRHAVRHARMPGVTMMLLGHCGRDRHRGNHKRSGGDTTNDIFSNHDNLLKIYLEPAAPADRLNDRSSTQSDTGPSRRGIFIRQNPSASERASIKSS